eukprot:GILK01009136.1.p1 GENE.GILK01009136.1~~GILK01009136.1.p1  ORF type:complete len:246 (-),score=33.71 GILK01009136.1:187-888(-)
MEDDTDDCMFDSNLFLNEDYTLQSFDFKDVTQKVLCLKSACTDFDLTGQVVWPAAFILSSFIVQHPDIFQSKSVLEVGAGVGLCGLLASRYALHTVLTDHNDTVLKVLTRNAQEHTTAPESIQCVKLDWGVNIDEFKQTCPKPFQVIIGADVVHWPDSVKPLFETVKALMSTAEPSVLLLSYISRSSSNDAALDKYSRELGFRCEELPLDFLQHTDAQTETKSAGAHLYRFTL